MPEVSTEFIAKPGETPKESNVFGVSIRGWIAWTAVLTVCVNQLATTLSGCWLSISKGDLSNLGSLSAVTEPLYGVVYMTIGYYFAKSTMPQGMTITQTK